MDHYNYSLYLESNSLKWCASLPTELPSAVCGIDHLPGVALGPGWEHKNRRQRLQKVCLYSYRWVLNCIFISKPKCSGVFFTEYSHCNISQNGNNEEDAAHDVCAAPKWREQSVKSLKKLSVHIQREENRSHISSSPVLDGALKGRIILPWLAYKERKKTGIYHSVSSLALGLLKAWLSERSITVHVKTEIHLALKSQ